MKILVTGAAGFIGYSVVQALSRKGNEVVGLDNINDYYDTTLKYARLENCGIKKDSITWYKFIQSEKYPHYRFIRMHIEDKQAMQMLFANESFDVVCHLAAQAGVRYSIENPEAYIHSNIEGFLHIIEGCRNNAIKHLVYASSSSVYGLNGNVPFSEKAGIAHPTSLYAATKKANELMAHVYSHLYSIPSTGLRFFTVYGPWGRPDMSPFLFTDAILSGRPIKVFNNGNMLRDFTYIDDITEGVVRIIEHSPAPDPSWDATRPDPSSSNCAYRIYNIGHSAPVPLMDFIETIEKNCGKKAEKEFLPMQAGDVFQTHADTTALQQEIHFKPSTSLIDGIRKYLNWFKKFYNINE